MALFVWFIWDFTKNHIHFNHNVRVQRNIIKAEKNNILPGKFKFMGASVSILYYIIIHAGHCLFERITYQRIL